MNHTPQIKRAIQFAARKHNGQLRKEAEALPYVTHPFLVALLVAEDGADDDVVTAALLHDTLEDTDTTREEIVETFNERVAELVESLTEVRGKNGKEFDTWRERKEDYLARLEKATNDAILIAAADKIDNIESKLEAFKKEGKSFLKRWRQSPEEYLWFHSEALRIAETRLPDHPLTSRLAQVHAKEQEVFS